MGEWAYHFFINQIHKGAWLENYWDFFNVCGVYQHEQIMNIHNSQIYSKVHFLYTLSNNGGSKFSENFFILSIVMDASRLRMSVIRLGGWSFAAHFWSNTHGISSLSIPSFFVAYMDACADKPYIPSIFPLIRTVWMRISHTHTGARTRTRTAIKKERKKRDRVAESNDSWMKNKTHTLTFTHSFTYRIQGTSRYHDSSAPTREIVRCVIALRKY